MLTSLADTLPSSLVDLTGTLHSHSSTELPTAELFPLNPDLLAETVGPRGGAGAQPEPSKSVETPAETPGAVCQTTAPADHRRFPRRSAGGFVSVVRYPADTKLTVEWTNWLMQTSGLTGELIDLSRSGLALLLLQPLEVGDMIVARLSQLESSETLDVIAEVVRVVDVGDQRWKIMTEFASPLEFDDAYEFARHDQDAVPPLFPPFLP